MAALRSLTTCGARYLKLSILKPVVATLCQPLSTDAEFGNSAFQPKTTPMLPPGTFSNKTAFITGGGTGLGKSVASSLAFLGANVLLISRREEVLKQTCDELRKVTRSQIDYAVADIRDVDAVREALNICSTRFGLPNLIVNNAAGNLLCPSERLSPDAFSSVIDIVLKGTGIVTLEVAKALIKAKQSGTFLCVSTVYAQTGSAFVMPSAAAKAGVETMVKSLAAEWGKYHLRLNAVAPGPIYTEDAFSRLDPTGQFTKELGKRIPAGRLGLMEEFANLACYLLSDYSSWINGEVVRFDGGETPAIAGEFNILTRLLKDNDWDSIALLAKSTSKST
ncbi:2 4-dienoyl-CoA reductase mitochondrial [Fasciolopsis buskii]|uniref:2 4-dienoyl-CoA reductase mitochondrial n=1 Tax=Fasciolopsis buskii TaxID=27845 RepID=A0A8E0VFA5_9TREM|nr:2 4-dienoyl-CoA reductase mitochondrial [Fasciolopsis buski]